MTSLLVIAGSTRSASWSKKLARAACGLAQAAGHAATFVDLREFGVRDRFEGSQRQPDEKTFDDCAADVLAKRFIHFFYHCVCQLKVSVWNESHKKMNDLPAIH